MDIFKKKLFNKDKEFIDISHNLKKEIVFFINKGNIKNLGGYKSGNLNIDPGKYGNEFLYLLLKKILKSILNLSQVIILKIIVF